MNLDFEPRSIVAVAIARGWVKPAQSGEVLAASHFHNKNRYLKPFKLSSAERGRKGAARRWHQEITV